MRKEFHGNSLKLLKSFHHTTTEGARNSFWCLNSFIVFHSNIYSHHVSHCMEYINFHLKENLSSIEPEISPKSQKPGIFRRRTIKHKNANVFLLSENSHTNTSIIIPPTLPTSRCYCRSDNVVVMFIKFHFRTLFPSIIINHLSHNSIFFLPRCSLSHFIFPHYFAMKSREVRRARGWCEGGCYCSWVNRKTSEIFAQISSQSLWKLNKRKSWKT